MAREQTVSAPFDLHIAYVIMMVLGFALVTSFRVTKPFTRAEDRKRYYTLQIITLVAAVVGAKFAVVLGDALWPLQPFNDWYALLGSGRSIVGALLFGFLAAEAAKPLLHYDIPPNDRFAVILPFSIGVGRIGCLIVGCCRGVPWNPISSYAASGTSRPSARNASVRSARNAAPTNTMRQSASPPCSHFSTSGTWRDFSCSHASKPASAAYGTSASASQSARIALTRRLVACAARPAQARRTPLPRSTSSRADRRDCNMRLHPRADAPDRSGASRTPSSRHE